MKKQLFSWMTIALMAFVCAGFAACGGSDDEDTPNGGGGDGSGASALVGTWRKYSSSLDGTPSTELGHVLWEFTLNGTMYEHDIDDNLNIIEGTTETFKYRTENGHLYTDKLKSNGYRNEWKDEGAYTITGDILQVNKSSGSIKRYKKIG